MNFEQARNNMIEQQIRTWDVLDQNVLNLMTRVRREDFIPEEYRLLAFADTSLPIGQGQVTMPPKVEARMLQALDINPEDKILEIGTGCAYVTALLAQAGQHVISVDIFPEFTQAASIKLSRHAVKNVTLETGDALKNLPDHGPYDVIAVTGSMPELTDGLQQQLKIMGRLFVIIGNSPVMEAWLITRTGANEWSRESLFETDLPPLIGAHQAPVFKL